jgi:hypothetical protein
MIIKIIAVLLFATVTTMQYIHLASKKNADIEKVKNKSKMEDFYSHACKNKDIYVRQLTRDLLDKAVRGNTHDPMSAKLVEAVKDVDDISAVKIKQVWRSELGGRKEFWIAECEIAKTKKSFNLYFVKNYSRLVLDTVD